MIEYWCCGNIPPRPLDDKESGGKKKEKTRRWLTNQRDFFSKSDR
jgi:hypothetical protein